MFGDPLLEMVDSAIADHPQLEDHMDADGKPIHPHSHPPELEQELSNIPFDTLRSLMLTSRDFVMLTGAFKCSICLKRVDRNGTMVLCDMCEAPFHFDCSNCAIYTGDEEGRSICRHCRNVRRCVLAVELIKHCPICSSHAEQIEQRIINASTAAHIRHRFNALEIVTHRLISDKAFEMLQSAESEVMQTEMAHSHKDEVDPELDESALNSSLLDEINGNIGQSKGNNTTQNLSSSRPPTPDADKKPAAQQLPLDGTPISTMKGRKLTFQPIKSNQAIDAVAEASEPEVGEDEEMEEEEEPNRDEGGLLAKQKGNLGRSTPPLNDSMDTSASVASTGSSASASTASQGTDSAASEERTYETRRRTTLKPVGKRLLPSRKCKKLQDDGVYEVNDDDEDET